MSKLINNFTNAGAIAMTSVGPVAIGSTLYGVAITGEILLGDANRTDHLKGSVGNDYIEGGNRADVIIGGPGDDVLTGGAPRPGHVAADMFVFRPGSGHDVITDFQGHDQIRITQYLKHGNPVTLSDTSAGAVIDFGTGDSVTLLGVASSQLVQTPHGFELGHLLVG